MSSLLKHTSEEGAHLLIRNELTSDMACFCFDVLVRHLKNLAPPDDSHLPKHSIPLFVTWHSNDKRLRGCIGTFKPIEFPKDLTYYSLARYLINLSSAVNDRRFNPITYSEISNLLCSVSVLVSFESCAAYDDWVIGTHGIQIYFYTKKHEYSATFLPDVIKEQGWDHEKTIHSLVRKSGYRGLIDRRLLVSLKIVRYNSFKATASYQDYTLSRFYTSTRVC
ncbi:hypothetical protein HZS_2372 [Henneguya salminicola]|uniref:AMME syndrome candidate gene 1 protein homolog (Trinotate prediction) n=1 Tax=Henneguya salminicola TaxID=69463 RepID=A0A6G3MI97_HENSL|nr:hypothetical protein HZS_2372 [Henneguya salminicola]